MTVFLVSAPYQEATPQGVFSTFAKAADYAKSIHEGTITSWNLDEFSPEYPFQYHRDFHEYEV